MRFFKLVIIGFGICNSLIVLSQVKETYFNATEKPWTYWWWMGNSVTMEGISENLEDLHAAGIGGVHIVPIYGEKGDEPNYLDFLSPEWMEMLRHTADEAQRLGMGVDMTPGTGWPFGGPTVSIKDAAKEFYVRKVEIKENTNIHEYFKPNGNAILVALAAYDEKGIYKNITSNVATDGLIRWEGVPQTWKVYAAFQSNTLQNVKRSAPGVEGLVIDNFNDSSLFNYMKKFEDVFAKAGIPKGKIRSFYNDSYEVYGANWTSDFFLEFKNRRGYELPPYMRYLADTTGCEIRQRLISDYCETISDLLYDRYTKNLVNKCHEMGMLVRNQAHGSPGNLLDLYALADIPETESFGVNDYSIPGLRKDSDYNFEQSGKPDLLTMKFASSSAHITGKKLVSSESTTWLGEHFKVSLSQIKPQIDELFVAGINHVFFHGTTYSPKEKPFPGRLFYASTNYGPTSHFYNELPALTGYISKCQSVLQNSAPDNDILLYFPIYEVWQKTNEESIMYPFQMHNSKEWIKNSGLGDLAQRLWDNGFSFDYISDRMIAMLNVEGNNLVSGETRYKTIVVPSIEYIPVETLAKLKDLAKKGATIIFEKNIPMDVPGLFDLEKRRSSLEKTKEEMLHLHSNVHVTPDVIKSLPEHGVFSEEMAGKGLEFVRKKSDDCTIYFVTNLSDKFNEDWIQLSTKSRTIEIYDPVNERRGKAALRYSKKGTELFLQLLPGQSCILTCSNKPSNKTKWNYTQVDEATKLEIDGEWLLKPTIGAPEIPKPIKLNQLGSWTVLGGKFETYSGKAIYSNEFEVPNELLSADGFILDLGEVRETAAVKINGKEIGLDWCLPNRLLISEGIIQQYNTIEIEVTNLSFNRIIQLDRDGVNWKNFHDINFVNICYEPFDASSKKPEESGLLSKVFLIPYILKKP